MDHLAEEGYVSEFNHGLVHKPISVKNGIRRYKMELAEDFPSLELQESKAKLLMESDITRSSSQRS